MKHFQFLQFAVKIIIRTFKLKQSVNAKFIYTFCITNVHVFNSEKRYLKKICDIILKKKHINILLNIPRVVRLNSVKTIPLWDHIRTLFQVRFIQDSVFQQCSVYKDFTVSCIF